jgi:hypothetical protein
MGVEDKGHAEAPPGGSPHQQALEMVRMDDVEALLPQETAQEARQGRIDPEQLPDGRPRSQLAVGRHVGDPVDLDVGGYRALPQVVGGDVDLVTPVGHGLRQPQDADGRATRDRKGASRDDGDF